MNRFARNLWRARIRKTIHLRQRRLYLRTVWRNPTKWY